MKYRWKLLVLAVAALVFLLIGTECMYEIEAKDLFMISVQKSNNSVLISPWMDSDGKLYVMLPSYADMQSTKILIDGKAEVSLDGKKLRGELNCGSYQLEIPYQFTFQKFGKDHNLVLTFMKSNSVSTMYINTETGNMDYIHSKKRNTEAGTVQLYLTSGELQYEGMVKSIAGRGNTTWDNYEKKSYTIDLGVDNDLLGMGAARDWVLLANADDPSHMRNKIVYDFAERAGLPYSPESNWVDLYLNGEYTGLYLLTEQNEVHPQRIPIENENSFLVTMEGRGRMVSQNLPYIETDLRQALRIRYPKNPSEEQLQNLTQIWNRIEKAIVETGGANNENSMQWTSLIDLDSWARKYLIEEIFGSLDACYKSQYFYYDGNREDALVVAGPVWDFDLSMGRTWHTESLDFLWANRLHVDDQYDTPWFHELYKKDEFSAKLKEVFEQEMLPLLQVLYGEQVSQYHSMISQAAHMDQIRWHTENFVDEVELIKDYLARRINFLTNLWIEERKFHLIEARSEGTSYAYFAVEDGEAPPSLPVLESSEHRMFRGWYTEAGLPFDEVEIISEDMCVYAKWEGTSTRMSLYMQYLIPLAVIALMGGLILFVDIFRTWKGRCGR